MPPARRETAALAALTIFADTLDAMPTDRLEHRTRLIGRDIFARARRAEPSPLRLAWWNRQLLDWVMEDEALKVQLFRFIEALPNLRGPAAVAAHLRQYLRDGRRNGHALPGIVNLATAYPTEHSLHGRLAAFAARFGSTRMAGQFIAGATAEEAIATILRLRRAHMTFTLDVLGETVLCTRDAEHDQRIYLDLVDALAAAAPRWPADPLLDEAPFGKLPRVNISIKLSGLAPKFDPIAYERVAGSVIERVRPILRKARQRGVFINVDMEHYAVRDLTLDIFMRVLSEPEFRDWPDAGIVVQAYLRDSENDLRKLIDWTRRRGTPITVRLVKGAYWDHETTLSLARGWPIPVWTEKWQSDANFELLARMMLENHAWTRPAFASHNVRSLASAIAVSERLRVPPRTLEVQMLYGMGDPLKAALIEMGQRVRIYTPFGDLMRGMAYFMRRLLENTANESFLRQSFSEHVPEDILLVRPQADAHIPPTPLPDFRYSGPDEDETMTPFRNEPQSDFARADVRDRMAAALRDAQEMAAPPLSGSPPAAHFPPMLDGDRIDGATWHDCRNPARPAQVLTRIGACLPDDVDLAVAAGQERWEAWADTPPEERAAVLYRAAASLRHRRFEFAARLLLELGMTWRDADAEVAAAIDALEFNAREILRLTAAPRRRDVPGETNEYLYQPRGVVAVITSFNQPLAAPAAMIAAAMAAGNTVVFAPALETGGVAARLVTQVIGVDALVLVFGDEALAERLAGHPQVSTVAFAGRRGAATRVAAAVSRVQAEQSAIKRLVLQVDGVSTLIIDDDTDLDEAVLGTLASGLQFAGQARCAPSRVVVIGDAYRAFVERLSDAAREVSVGPTDDPASSIGPLISPAAMEEARRLVAMGRSDARVAVERRHDDLIASTGGYFCGPVVLVDVPPDSPIAHAEIDAPILCVIPAADLDEAIGIANDTRYPLAAGFYSRSPANIERVRRELHVPNVFINRKITADAVDRQPFGGLGLAGTGRPAGGPDFIREFMDARCISENVVRHGLAAPDLEPSLAAHPA